MDVQKSLVEYIQQITDNPDNVIAFRPQELAEYTTEWVTMKLVVQHVEEIFDNLAFLW